MAVINIEYIDNTYLRVSCFDNSVEYDMSEYFSFFVPGYKFSPKYKAKIWDGRVRLYTPYSKKLYVGLLEYLKKFAEMNDHDLVISNDVCNIYNSELYSDEKFKSFINDIGSTLTAHGEKISLHDHQLKPIHHFIKYNRATLVSPTSSGKSLILYMSIRWYLEHTNSNILLLVPTTMLVEQMESDFIDYSSTSDWNAIKYIHKIYAGQDKNVNKRVTISTWQSAMNMSREWFEKFEIVFNDETHNAKSKELSKIFEKLVNCNRRYGTTGTLQSAEANKLVIQGVIGPAIKFISTSELMEKGIVANLTIKNLILKYSEEESKEVKKLKYQQEISHIIDHKKRTKFISNIVDQYTDKNILIVARAREHVDNIFNSVKKTLEGTGRNVYKVNGDISVKDRESIRKNVEKESGAVIVATLGVFSTGVSIRNINIVILAAPTKSEITTLQTIGRGLRISDKKDSVLLIDLIDNFSYKKHQNYAVKHFLERLKMYQSEKFNYKTIEISF